MTTPARINPAIQLAARHQQWRLGDLSWKLDLQQLRLYEQFRRLTGKQGVLEGARKLGKTFLYGCIALETAIHNPGKQINWASGTGKACRNILVPILEEISQDAPEECKGRYDHQTGQWKLPNGAFIQIFGAETKRDCERGRGPSSILNIVDEAGFIDLLEYMLDSIFAPQQRRIRRLPGTFIGLTLLCSTTPYTPTHPFCVVADAAVPNGAFAKRTIYDSGFETPEQIEHYIAEEASRKNLTPEAFKATSTFKREYLSERVIDADVVVFPEFSEVQSNIVKEWPRPVGFEQFIYKRVSVDPGGVRDPTGILGGYTDFTNAKVVVEWESLLPKPNTEQIAVEIRERETEFWGDTQLTRISRVVDDPTGRVCLDLWELERLSVERATKNDRAASIGLIRTWLVDGTLVIHPRCVLLIHQLLTAINDRTRKDYARNSEGHFDLCAALQYFCRDLSLTTNPFPVDFSPLTGRTMAPTHPLMVRREQMGIGRPQQGLAGVLLGGNKFVAGQLKRRR